MNAKFFFIVLFYVSCTLACKSDQSGDSEPSLPNQKPNYAVLAQFPHDPKAFTQGLVMDNETIIEGTGLNGQSWISTYEHRTLGYDKKVILPEEYFGEGLTLLNNKIYQLTYKKQIGFVYDFETFEKIGTFNYPNLIKEGWGITHNNEHLIVSDGSDKLYFIDSSTYKIHRKITVHKKGSTKSKLNELEFIEGYIYANVWNSSLILKINPSNGAIEDKYDLTALMKMEKSQNPKIDVLNGIAYDNKRKELIVTGKYWQNYYRLTLNPS